MQIPDILRNKAVQLVSTAVTALVVGGVGGYIYGKKQGTVNVVPAETTQLTLPFSKKVGIIESIEDTGDGIVVTGQITDPQIAEALHITTEGETIVDPRAAPTPKRDYTKPLKDAVAVAQLEPADEPIQVNVFHTREDDGQWVWEDELSNRQAGKPYVIHVEEFIPNEMDFKQETLTYYAGDDIMADPAETPVYDYNGLMGPLKWGHGSGDANLVYIRNETLHMEWEVIRHTGSFEIEVLGATLDQMAEDELRHAGPMKMRRGD